MLELLNIFNSPSQYKCYTNRLIDKRTIKIWKEHAKLVTCSYTVADNCRVNRVGKRNHLLVMNLLFLG